jgi:hypothetical protein
MEANEVPQAGATSKLSMGPDVRRDDESTKSGFLR